MSPKRVRQWWRDGSPYFTALLILVGSRLVVALAIVFSSKFVQRAPGEIFVDVTPRWYRYLLRWDAGWYLKIAREGYTYNGDNLVQQPVVFYPLYPLISKAVSIIFGISEEAALLVVSNASFVLATLIFVKLVRDEYGANVALYATTALCFFPTSLFFSAGYTESLTLLLIVAFFLLLKKERYVLASVAAGLALATRSTGIVLCLPLILGLWRKWSRDPRRLALRTALCMIVATSGLWLYMIYLCAAFHSPFAFALNERAWVGITTTTDLIRVLTLQPLRHLADVWTIGPDPNTLSPWLFLLFLFLILLFRKWLSTSFLAYALGVLLLPYLAFSGKTGFLSFDRYVMLAFPAFVVAAKLFRERFWLGLGVMALSGALLFMHAAFYAQFYFIG